MSKEKVLRDGKKKRPRKRSVPVEEKRVDSVRRYRPDRRKRKRKASRFPSYSGYEDYWEEQERQFNRWNRARTTGLTEEELKASINRQETADCVIHIVTLEIDPEAEEQRRTLAFLGFLSRIGQ